MSGAQRHFAADRGVINPSSLPRKTQEERALCITARLKRKRETAVGAQCRLLQVVGPC